MDKATESRAILQALRVDQFTDLGAYFHHDGNEKRPHPLLTSGLHSDGFFNWSIVAQYPHIAQETAYDIALLVYGEIKKSAMEVTRIIGPGAGAITLAHCIAVNWEMMGKSWPTCKSGFTEKQPDGTMSLSRFNVKDELVLACEDTITSGGSVNKTITAIQNAGGKVLPVIAAVCNRSGQSEIDGRRIVALIDVAMHNWTPEECPLCKKGSEAIRPKQEGNWERLSRAY
jgi:orotate phosphoribosyltransferase